MANYRPGGNFNVPMKLLVPTSKRVQGVLQKIYPSPLEVTDDYLIYGSFRTFGGTENTSNDQYTVIDTAVVETWYRPDIQGNCRIYVIPTGRTYEIVSPPENIDMKNQFLNFKIRAVGGKA